eukprot:PLAT6639.1.p1 GENE.PLAT6639.1~~PLAT6639.1.p1  ORF type:complete len:1605 (+),score=860.88 PLAT6639.1:73-4887(+)
MSNAIEQFCVSPRWNAKTTAGLSLSGLTPCFEQIVLLGSVHLAFLIFLGIRYWQLRSVKPTAEPHEAKWLRYVQYFCISLNVLSPLLIGNALLALGSYAAFELFSSVALLITWLLCLAIICYGSNRARRSGSWIIRFLWLFSFTGHTVKLRSELAISDVTSYITIVYLASYVAQGVLVLISYFFKQGSFDSRAREEAAGGEGEAGDVEMEEKDALLLSDADASAKPSPWLSASFISRATFGWLGRLVRTGAKRPLMEDDIYALPAVHRASRVSKAFEAAWAEELASAAGSADSSRKPSLWAALYAVFGSRFTRAGAFLLVQSFLGFTGPLMLRELTRFTADASAPVWQGYVYVAAIFVASMVSALSENAYFDVVMRVGMDVRAALVTAVYRKMLRLSSKARQELSTGQLLNAGSSDAERLQMQITSLHSLWSSPLRICIGMYFLFTSPIGASALAGVAALFFLFPFQGKLVSAIGRYTRAGMKVSDSRLKAINELLAGMRVVKYYAWEDSFLKHVLHVREEELVWLRKSAIAQAYILLLIGLNPVVLAVATFGVFAATNGEMTPETAFFALSVFNMLLFPLMMLPRTLSGLIQARVNFRRIETVLSADELGEAAEHRGEAPIIVDNASMSWDAAAPTPTLRALSYTVNKGELLAVIGSTGSGKSSLLNALLGEMVLLKGYCSTQGSIAYVPQQSWIFNGTVRENILFGLPWDEGRYWRAVRRASLVSDFLQFAAGDATEIGEKGVNLSGGQRQRVSIARAIYSDCDVYLFDDPLSALDAHVSAEIFHDCVCGTLADKTRVLVTNQLHFVHAADRILVLKDGGIEQAGTYDELMEDEEGHFAALMREHAGAEDEDDSGTAEEGKDGEGKTEDEDKEEEDETSMPQVLIDSTSKDGHLTEKEERETGSIGWDVYWAYIRAAGGGRLAFTLAFFFLLREGFRVGGSFWLSIWSSDSLDSTSGFYVGIYAVFSLLQTFASLGSTLLGALAAIAASRSLHSGMFMAILRAPMAFFDTTPLGRIVSRFSGDISDIDRNLMTMLQLFVGGIVQLLGTMLVLGLSTPYVLLAFVPIMFAFGFVQNYYRHTSRELKRMDAISRSPIYVHFTESLDGIASIRSYGAVERMALDNGRRVNHNLRMYLMLITTNRWLSVRLELCGGLMVLAAGIFAVLGRATLGADVVGLALSYALTITTQLNMIVRFFTQVENSFNSVERVSHYSETEAEAAPIIDSNRPPEGWPAAGNIVIDDVVASYREGLPPVLRGLTVELRPSEKVGVVGRTGAGKSSLFQALFRIFEATSGSVTIDGVNIADIGLKDLRSALSIIPQEPVLFSGTVRTNLDPFETYEDHELWSVLERAHLKSVVESHPSRLEMPVAENGENFSVGQRQLICLARALLKKAKILVLDEATAAVDVDTDALIQKTIRDNFADCTTLTIAHRLNTIIDSDRVLVLNFGEVLEYDTPAALLAKPDSAFSSLVDETGPTNAAYLRRAAMGEVDVVGELEAKLATQSALTLQHVSRGPMQLRVEEAADAVMEAILQRHGRSWAAELAAFNVSKPVWLTHLFTRVAALHRAATEAGEEDGFDAYATALTADGSVAAVEDSIIARSTM